MGNRLIIDKNDDYIKKIIIYREGDLCFEFKDGSILDYFKTDNKYYYSTTIEIKKPIIAGKQFISRTTAIQIELKLCAIDKLINICKYLSKNLELLVRVIWYVFGSTHTKIIYYALTNTFEIKVQSEIENPLDKEQQSLSNIIFHISNFELSLFDMVDKDGMPIDYITYLRTQAMLQHTLAIYKNNKKGTE